jgi:hypothetical protein
MGLKMMLELPMSEVEAEKPVTYYDIGKGTTNKISNAVVEILRLPDIGKCVPGAKVGEGVKGRLVFQYNGPLTIRWVMDEKAPDQQALTHAENVEEVPMAKKARKSKKKTELDGIWDVETPKVKKTKKTKKSAKRR